MAEKTVLPFYQDSGYGYKICGEYSLEALNSALKYKPRPDDIFVASYPKCGTTWTQYIVCCILREGKPFNSIVDFICNTPTLEITGAEAAKTMRRPGAIKSHQPFDLIPWSSEAKYIYVTRNPKDCVVSSYFYTKNMLGYKFQNGNFDDYFELFMNGNAMYGDYFDHLLSWYKHRNDPNVFFITYEELKRDPKTCILNIAEFLDEKYKVMLVKNEDILNDILKYSSFDFMKQNLNRQMSEFSALPKDYIINHPDLPAGLKAVFVKGDGFFDPKNVSFIRKGIVGDFKNYLSPEQNRRMEEKFRARTEGTDIPNLWKDIM